MSAGDARTAPAFIYYPLALIVCALAGGIAADRYWPWPAELWWLTAGGVLIIWLAVWLLRRDSFASWLLLAGVFATGGAWHHAYWRIYPADEISRMVQEEAR